MQVGDIMTKEVITVSIDTALKEAAGILAKFRIHGLPVVDENKKVVGIATESDFFTKDASNIFLPTFLEFLSKKGTDLSEEMGSSEVGNKTKISDIMTTDCFTVQPDLPVAQLIEYFQEKNFNSVPVVDDQGFLVGIVSVMDVIKLL
jgi:CBS domain-containing protein